MPQGSSAVRPTNGLYLYLTHHVKWYIVTDVSAAIQSLETLVTVYHSKQRDISEDWKRRFYKRLLCRGRH